MSNQLTFNNVILSPVAQADNQIWLSSADLAKALGYSQENAVAKIFNRKADEFSDNMTKVVEVSKSKNLLSKTRIFSLRGCHLIAMFARTEIAKQFRVWVLNILDKEIGQPVVTPVNEKTTPDERTPLRQAVTALVGKAKIMHDEAYNMVNQYMGVNHIWEIPKEDLPKAVAYVHSLILMASQPKQETAQPHQRELYDILFSAVSSHVEVIRMTKTLMNAMHMGYQENSQLQHIQKYLENTVKYSLDHNITNRFGGKLYENGRVHSWHGGSFAIK